MEKIYVIKVEYEEEKNGGRVARMKDFPKKLPEVVASMLLNAILEQHNIESVSLGRKK